MVLIRRSGKAITGIFQCQGKIRLRVEVTSIEGMGAYQRSRFDDGTDLIPPALHPGYIGQDHVRGEYIRGQGGRK